MKKIASFIASKQFFESVPIEFFSNFAVFKIYMYNIRDSASFKKFGP